MDRSSRDDGPKPGEQRLPQQPTGKPESASSTQRFVDVVMHRLRLERALKHLHQHTHR